MSTPSPKGPFRMWQLFVIAFVFYALSFYTLGDKFVVKMVGDVAQAVGMSAVAYWVGRLFLHTRTHDMTSAQKAARENYLILMVGLIFAFSAIS